MLRILILLKLFMLTFIISNGQIVQESIHTKNDNSYSVTFNLVNLDFLNVDIDTLRVLVSGANANGTSGIGNHEPWPIPLEDVDLELFDIDGDMTYTLTLENVLPGDYKYKYGIVSANNGTVPNWNFPVPNFGDTLVFTLVDQNITMYDVLPPNSIEGVDNILDFNIYPNPSNGVFTIDIDKPCELTITNMAGKVIMKRKVNNNDIIDLSNQGQGLYSITAKTNGKTKTLLMVLQ
jgi:hypothetical protein